MYCIQCGTNNSDEALFCQRCGRQLKTETNDDLATLYSSPPQSAVDTPATPLSVQDSSTLSTPSSQSSIAPTQYAAPPPYAKSAYAANISYPPPPAEEQYALPNPYEPQVTQKEPPVTHKEPQVVPTPQKKGGRRLGVIGSIVGVILVLVFAGGGYAYANRSTPQKTLDTICTALLNGDYSTAYYQFSLNDTVRQQETEAQYASNLQHTDQTRGGLSSCIVNNVNENGTTATGTVTGSYGNGTSFRNIAILADENGTWRITRAA